MIINLRGPKSSSLSVIVSEEDYEYLNSFKWYATKGYPTRSASKLERTNGSPKTLYMHLVVAERMGIRVPGLEIDHRDVNPLNCTRTNLRVAARHSNQANGNKHRDNKSGYKGVTRSHNGKWRATLGLKYKQIWLGYFDTPEEAYAAYITAALKYFGEFAKI